MYFIDIEIQGQGQNEEAFHYKAQNMKTNVRKNSTYVVKIQQTVVSNSTWKIGLVRRGKDTPCKQQHHSLYLIVLLHSTSNLIDNCQIRNQSDLENMNLEQLKAIQNISEIVLKTQQHYGSKFSVLLTNPPT